MYIKCSYNSKKIIIYWFNEISLNGKLNTKKFEENNKTIRDQISNKIPDPKQPFNAMGNASNFRINAALLQSP